MEDDEVQNEDDIILEMQNEIDNIRPDSPKQQPIKDPADPRNFKQSAKKEVVNNLNQKYFAPADPADEVWGNESSQE